MLWGNGKFACAVALLCFAVSASASRELQGTVHVSVVSGNAADPSSFKTVEKVVETQDGASPMDVMSALMQKELSGFADFANRVAAVNAAADKATDKATDAADDAEPLQQLLRAAAGPLATAAALEGAAEARAADMLSWLSGEADALTQKVDSMAREQLARAQSATQAAAAAWKAGGKKDEQQEEQDEQQPGGSTLRMTLLLGGAPMSLGRAQGHGDALAAAAAAAATAAEDEAAEELADALEAAYEADARESEALYAAYEDDDAAAAFADEADGCAAQLMFAALVAAVAGVAIGAARAASQLRAVALRGGFNGYARVPVAGDAANYHRGGGDPDIDAALALGDEDEAEFEDDDPKAALKAQQQPRVLLVVDDAAAAAKWYKNELASK